MHLVRIYLEAALPSLARFYPPPSLPPSFISFHSFSHREPSPPSTSILAKQKATGHASGSRVSDARFILHLLSGRRTLHFLPGRSSKPKGRSSFFYPLLSPPPSLLFFPAPGSRSLRMDKRLRDPRFRIYYSECGATLRSDWRAADRG